MKIEKKKNKTKIGEVKFEVTVKYHFNPAEGDDKYLFSEMMKEIESLSQQGICFAGNKGWRWKKTKWKKIS